jgi:hypothetical protein
LEISQGNSRYSYLNKQKCQFFFFSCFCKKGDQESRTGPVWGFGTSGRGENVGRVCRRMHMVQILYVCKWKMRPVEIIPGMGEKG